MNRKTKVLLAGLSLLTLVVAGMLPVSAARENGLTRGLERRTIAQAAQQGNMSEQQVQELKDRLQKRKDELKLRLSNAQKNRLQSRCQNSQGVLKSVEGRIKGIQTSRIQIYGNLIDRLTSLSSRLRANNVDTTELDQNIEELKEKIEEFNTVLASYIQAVADLAVMQCKDDPEAFKASLNKARELQQELRQRGLEIKTFIQETLKPTLANIREQLVDSTEGATNGENE
jgi:hypothetical protein